MKRNSALCMTCGEKINIPLCFECMGNMHDGPIDGSIRMAKGACSVCGGMLTICSSCFSSESGRMREIDLEFIRDSW